MAIELEGLEEALEGIESLVSTEKLARAMQKVCLLVERSAKQKAPKGHGDLRRSIESRVDNDGINITGVVFSPLEYAPYVEYGTGLFAEEQGRKDVPWHYKDDAGEWHTTSGQDPKPFMRPALNENRDEIIRTLKGGINND